MSRIGIPLTDETLASLPLTQQQILRAFFIEANILIKENILERCEDGRLVPLESLQLKYDAIVRFSGDKYCQVRQRVQLFDLCDLPTFEEAQQHEPVPEGTIIH